MNTNSVNPGFPFSLPHANPCVQNPSPALAWELAQKLEHWFQYIRRDFPWRKTTDPYEIWVSEVMLQQTRTETVLRYYLPFLSRFPQVKDLAQASEEDLLKTWEGLGYYRRARNLQKGVQKLLENFSGIFPKNRKELLQLPGIGLYTAGAILSFAFHLPYAAVDGNSLRVLSRLFLKPWSLASSAHRKSAADFVEKFFLQNPAIAPHRWNEGLIELGALICLPQNPLCSTCPFQGLCKACNDNLTMHFPIPNPGKELPYELRTPLLFWDSEENESYCVQRSDAGLLANLYEFPTLDCDFENPESLTEFLESAGIPILSLEQLPPCKHRFTHKIWQLQAYKIQTDSLIKQKENLINLPFLAFPETLRILSFEELALLPFSSSYHGYRKLICTQ